MSAETQSQQRYIPPSRRRDKPILSCSLCRRRKLKCDRQQPCKACVDRGLSLSCTYSRNQHAPATPSDPKPHENVHDRIDQLEKLVTTLMKQKRNSGTFNPAAVSSSPKLDDGHGDLDMSLAPDRVKLERDETSYTNSSHWTSILDGIDELRDQLDQIPTTPQSQDADNAFKGPELLFGRNRHVTREEILVVLPSRAEADELVVKYFSFMDMAPVVLHRPTFLREYDKFWENPRETPIMWIGLLYGIFCIATHFDHIENTYSSGTPIPSHLLARVDFYREKVVQCMILANYPKCPPYTLETMLSYFIVEYVRSSGAQFGSWLLTGILVRTAFRMGYHREPSRFPNISPFKAEMRRRLWTIIVQLDMMSSVQVGLPTIIQPSIPDVMEPRNLSDNDLHENMTELPPSRPDTESTIMLYFVYRNRLLKVFAKIQEHANASVSLGYREALELDVALRTTYETMPEVFKDYKANGFDVSSEFAMRKLYLSMTYLKCMLMIHRPFLLLGREDNRYEYSRTACLDAALEIIDFQKLLEAESRSGYEHWSHTFKLWTSIWRLSSLVSHDFFLATTVIVLDLNKDFVEPLPEAENTPRIRFESGRPTRAELIEALAGSYHVWQLASTESQEAARIAAAVQLVLAKASSVELHSSATPIALSHNDGVEFIGAHQEPTSHMLVDPDIPTSSFDNTNNIETSLPFHTNDLMMDFGGNFDWAGLESQYSLPSFEQNLQNSYFG